MEDQRDNPNIIGSEIIIYQTEDGYTKIDVKFEDETVWLTQAQLCELYQTSKSNISEHIKHIFEEEELDEESVVRKFRTTAADGKNYNTIHYNLDMIISLGYRVKSKIATNFRRWATERLKEYMIKGFTMDDERLKNLGGGNYWKELLDRIRDIRSSEKVMYRQVLDLYATSVDYDPKQELVLELPDGEITAANAASLTGKLSQLANGAIYSDTGDTIEFHDRKLDALEDIIETLLQSFELRRSLLSRTSMRI